MMPHSRRKNPAILVSPAGAAPRAAKRARPRRHFTAIQEEVILAAEAVKQLSPAEPIDMDSEDEFMDLGTENEHLPYPNSENPSPDPTPVPTLVMALQRPSPQNILKRHSSQGLSSSIHALKKDNNATEQELCSSFPRSSQCTVSRIIEHCCDIHLN